MEKVRKVQQNLLKCYQDDLLLIQYLADYDALQDTETDIIEARSIYEKFMKVKLLNRKKVVYAMEKHVETIKSYVQCDSNGDLPVRSQLLQQPHAEKNKIAIKEYEILLWKL